MRIRRKKLLLTALLVLALLAAGRWASSLMHLEYWRPDKRRWGVNLFAYQRSGQRADVLMLGSSSALFGISSVVLESELANETGGPSVYNISQAFGNTLKSAMALEDVIRSNGCPRLVVVEVSPSLINGGIEQNRHVSDHGGLSDLALLGPDLLSVKAANALVSSGWSGLASLYYHWFDPPPVAWIDETLAKRGSRWGSLPPRSIQRLDEPTVLALERRTRERWVRRNLRHFTTKGPPSRALQSIVDMSSECGARLVLIRIPHVTKPSGRRNEKRFARYMRAFVKRNRVPFHEIDKEQAGLGPEHFMSFAHLNYDGADRLSRYVAHRFLSRESNRPSGD